MNEMIERVTAAIEAAIWAGLDPDTPDSDALARAAIEAMREPTEAMMKAARNTEGMKAVDNALVGAMIHGFTIPGNKKSPLEQAWQAMIDAALKKG